MENKVERVFLSALFFALFLISLSLPVKSPNFIIYNISNPNQIYFLVNGTTGRIGIGVVNPSYPFEVGVTSKFTNAYFDDVICNGCINASDIALMQCPSGKALSAIGGGGYACIDIASAVPANISGAGVANALAYWVNGTTLGSLSFGTSGQFLKSQGPGNLPIWSDIVLGVDTKGIFVAAIYANAPLSVSGGVGTNATAIISLNYNTTVFTILNNALTLADAYYTGSAYDSRFINVGEAAGGDLTGTYPNPNVSKIRGITVDVSTPTIGQALIYNGSHLVYRGVIEDSDISTDANGRIIQINVGGTNRQITASDVSCTDCITLGTETVGDYIRNITAGTGISISGTPGEGWTPTISVVFGSSAGTAAEGNKQITISAGTGLTGGGTVTIGAGGSVSLSIDTNVVPRKNTAETISGSWTFQNDLTVMGNLRVAGNLTYVNAQTLNVNGSIIPPLDNWFDIGSSTRKWANIYAYNIYQGNNRVIDTVIAGNGLTGGGSGPSVTLDVNVNTNKGLQIVSDAIEVKLGAGLTFDGSGNIALTTTGVTAGTYGSSRQIPVITVDQYGRITSASNVTISELDPLWSGNLTSIGTNYLIKRTSSGIGQSLIYDTGTNVGIGTTSPAYKLDVSGTFRASVSGGGILELDGSGNIKIGV